MGPYFVAPAMWASQGANSHAIPTPLLRPYNLPVLTMVAPPVPVPADNLEIADPLPLLAQLPHRVTNYIFFNAMPLWRVPELPCGVERFVK
jgi:hypothetical protein